MSGYKPTSEQQAIIDAARTGRNLVVQAGAGTGKALRDDQPVLTPSGFKPIAALQVGDQVIGSQGKPTTVTGVYPQGVRPLYAVVVSDGTEVIADADHLWLTETTRDRQKHRNNWQVRTTAEIASTLTIRQSGRDRINHYLPMLAAPVAGDLTGTPLDPWLVGLLIGDGGFSGRQVRLHNPEPRILNRVRELLPAPARLVPMSTGNHDDLNWNISAEGATEPGRRGFYNPVNDALRDLGLMGKHSQDKHIPERLLHAAPEQRLALLRGIMDADGHAARTHTEYTTTSEVLADQVRWLVESLCGTVKTARKVPTYTYNSEKREGRPAWRLHITLPPHINPFAYSRNADRYAAPTKYMPRRQIMDVRPVEPGSATCISVDAADELYATAGCVLTHNTSTLKMVSRALADRTALYVAYNRATADEARASFPDSVTVKTAHGLAYAAVGSEYRHRLNGPRQPAFRAAELLGMNTWLDLDKTKVAPRTLARITIETVDHYCYSADHEIGTQHVPFQPGLDRDQNTAIATYVVPYARKAWADIASRDGKLKFQHDHYLKLYALGNPTLPFDTVMLDECQDSNPLVANLVQSQNCQKIAVGDSAQQLYGWRGARDCLDVWPADQRLYLSQSWRFGNAVAIEANKWLSLLDTPLRLSGNDALASRVEPVANPAAILCRTNGRAMAEVMQRLNAGVRVALVGGGGAIKQLALAAQDLKTGRPTYHPELFVFTTWQEVQDYSDEPSGQDLRPFVQLIDEHGPDAVIAATEKLTDERRADVTISTGHKAKGREWDSVLIAKDFTEPELDPETGEYEEIPPADIMLAYVSVTRAKLRLDTGGLAWIDKYLAAL
ncbi:UvrD-helicase domain-containing protein [Nocardia gipuzkoensis]|uniref:UvrD-helicase domain-containing protein n=1 Tax=Nocardia gipuzkoensis TaxID=2749991 RepID=UPI00237E0CCC|nr:UvrD-helicase domain-containing protein [Nocardia gipuzkoensis]MDE1673850.1 UvrD-helicase domain-containing protein [Nocardia gipuzkoensis]